MGRLHSIGELIAGGEIGPDAEHAAVLLSPGVSVSGKCLSGVHKLLLSVFAFGKQVK